MQFKVFYGVSLEYEENKWLHKELSKHGQVKVVDVADFWYKLRRWQPHSFLGQLAHVFISWYQALKLVYQTDSQDIVITRSHGVGLIFMLIVNKLGLKRRMVSYNWIDIPKKRYVKLAKIAISQNNFVPVVNDRRLLSVIKDKFALKSMQGIFIPDTYDTEDEFLPPQIKVNKYIFAGGVNNRDWKTLLQVANKLPYIKFHLVVNKYLWQCEFVPRNVNIHYDLSVEEYNALMKGASVCIVPLKEDRVSGLINIIKAHQYGIPAITTDMECTKIYYPLELRNTYLYKAGNSESLQAKVEGLLANSEVEYIGKTNRLQQYLKAEFSSDILVERLIGYLRQLKWLKGENNEICGNSYPV